VDEVTQGDAQARFFAVPREDGPMLALLLPVQAKLQPSCHGEAVVLSLRTAPRDALALLEHMSDDVALLCVRREADTFEEEIHGDVHRRAVRR